MSFATAGITASLFIFLETYRSNERKGMYEAKKELERTKKEIYLLTKRNGMTKVYEEDFNITP